MNLRHYLPITISRVFAVYQVYLKEYTCSFFMPGYFAWMKAFPNFICDISTAIILHKSKPNGDLIDQRFTSKFSYAYSIVYSCLCQVQYR